MNKLGSATQKTYHLALKNHLCLQMLLDVFASHKPSKGKLLRLSVLMKAEGGASCKLIPP